MIKVGEGCAIYLRVSTEEQTIANQVPEVDRYISARGFRIVTTYTETVSGAARHMPELERMMGDAHRRRFDTLVVWALDRLGRRMVETINLVLELERYGVNLVSLREPWLETSGPVRSLLVSIFAWVAEQERTRQIERTRAGIARAKAQGMRFGRPAKTLNHHAIRIELDKGGTLNRVAARMGVGRSTLCRELERYRALGIDLPAPSPRNGLRNRRP